ncbi:MAG: hypothetical protein ABIJ27_07545 [Candidatus Omnitrophota bacterium]
MPEREKVVNALYEAVDSVNQMLAPEERLGKSPDAALTGESSSLDSMGFVNLIVAVEQKFEEDFGVALTLMSEKALAKEESPFATIRTLAEYILSILKEKNGA